VTCDSRLERSALNEDEVEGMVALGTMVSFCMVATSPRWEVDVIRLPSADLSSWEAVHR
jgi:hypothetical protein